MKKTMQQLLAALMGNIGSGPGDGNGEGGNRALHSTPMYGPTRTEYNKSALAYGEYSPGKGRVRSKGQQKIGTHIDSLRTMDSRESHISHDVVPLKYKDAVKIYFSENQPNQE